MPHAPLWHCDIGLAWAWWMYKPQVRQRPADSALDVCCQVTRQWQLGRGWAVVWSKNLLFSQLKWHSALKPREQSRAKWLFVTPVEKTDASHVFGRGNRLLGTGGGRRHKERLSSDLSPGQVMTRPRTTWPAARVRQLTLASFDYQRQATESLRPDSVRWEQLWTRQAKRQLC